MNVLILSFTRSRSASTVYVMFTAFHNGTPSTAVPSTVWYISTLRLRSEKDTIHHVHFISILSLALYSPLLCSFYFISTSLHPTYHDVRSGTHIRLLNIFLLLRQRLCLHIGSHYRFPVGVVLNAFKGFKSGLENFLINICAMGCEPIACVVPPGALSII